MQEGRILASMSGDNADGTTNIIPKMDLDKLLSGYKHVINQLYSPLLFNDRVKIFLREYKAPKVKIKSDVSNLYKNVIAFIRSIYILGITDKERIYYWKLFVWTLFRKPKRFGLSITFAIYGYHFRKISEKCQ
jgi:hypothetical protein